jgi:hypothetical protein
MSLSTFKSGSGAGPPSRSSFSRTSLRPKANPGQEVSLSGVGKGGPPVLTSAACDLAALRRAFKVCSMAATDEAAHYDQRYYQCQCIHRVAIRNSEPALSILQWWVAWCTSNHGLPVLDPIIWIIRPLGCCCGIALPKKEALPASAGLLLVLKQDPCTGEGGRGGPVSINSLIKPAPVIGSGFSVAFIAMLGCS